MRSALKILRNHPRNTLWRDILVGHPGTWHDCFCNSVSIPLLLQVYKNMLPFGPPCINGAEVFLRGGGNNKKRKRANRL